MPPSIARVIEAAIAAAVCGPIVGRAGGAEDAVVVLADENFTTAVNNGAGSRWFVKFYAPWCGHCKRLEPTWNQLPARLAGNVRVAKVDVTANERLGREFGINGFPDLRLVAERRVYPYEGERSVDAMAAWAGGDYLQSSSIPVPADITIADTVEKLVTDYIRHAVQVFHHFPSIMPLVFMLGFLCGLVVSLGFGVGEPAEEAEESEEEDKAPRPQRPPRSSAGGASSARGPRSAPPAKSVPAPDHADVAPPLSMTECKKED